MCDVIDSKSSIRISVFLTDNLEAFASENLRTMIIHAPRCM